MGDFQKQALCLKNYGMKSRGATIALAGLRKDHLKRAGFHGKEQVLGRKRMREDPAPPATPAVIEPAFMAQRRLLLRKSSKQDEANSLDKDHDPFEFDDEGADLVGELFSKSHRTMVQGGGPHGRRHARDKGQSVEETATMRCADIADCKRNPFGQAPANRRPQKNFVDLITADFNEKPSEHSCGAPESGPPAPSNSSCGQAKPMKGRTVALGRFYGLRNLGNTCYLNSVVQALSGLPCFLQEIMDGQLAEVVGARSVFVALFKLFERMSKDPKDTLARILDPSFLKRSLVRGHMHFHGTEQQDAHELLCALLDAIHEDVREAAPALASLMRSKVSAPDKKTVSRNESLHDDSKCTKGNDNSVVSNDKVHVTTKPLESETGDGASTANLDEKLAEEYCPACNTFSAIVEQRVECLQCGDVSISHAEYHHFSLDIPEQDFESSSAATAPSLQHLFDNFFQCEELERECEHCASKDQHDSLDTQLSRCRITRQLLRLPRVLVLHLKRFSTREKCSESKHDLLEDLQTELSVKENRQPPDDEAPAPQTPANNSPDVTVIEKPDQIYEFVKKADAVCIPDLISVESVSAAQAHGPLPEVTLTARLRCHPDEAVISRSSTDGFGAPRPASEATDGHINFHDRRRAAPADRGTLPPRQHSPDHQRGRRKSSVVRSLKNLTAALHPLSDVSNMWQSTFPGKEIVVQRQAYEPSARAWSSSLHPKHVMQDADKDCVEAVGRNGRTTYSSTTASKKGLRGGAPQRIPRGSSTYLQSVENREADSDWSGQESQCNVPSQQTRASGKKMRRNNRNPSINKESSRRNGPDSRTESDPSQRSLKEYVTWGDARPEDVRNWATVCEGQDGHESLSGPELSDHRDHSSLFPRICEELGLEGDSIGQECHESAVLEEPEESGVRSANDGDQFLEKRTEEEELEEALKRSLADANSSEPLLQEECYLPESDEIEFHKARDKIWKPSEPHDGYSPNGEEEEQLAEAIRRSLQEEMTDRSVQHQEHHHDCDTVDLPSITQKHQGREHARCDAGLQSIQLGEEIVPVEDDAVGVPMGDQMKAQTSGVVCGTGVHAVSKDAKGADDCKGAEFQGVPCSSSGYLLRSVVHHIGDSAHSGHYVADVFDGATQNWVHHDDSFLSCVTSTDVVGGSAQSSAYLLFYVHNNFTANLSGSIA